MPVLRKRGFLVLIRKEDFLSAVITDDREEAVAEAQKIRLADKTNQYEVGVWEKIDWQKDGLH